MVATQSSSSKGFRLASMTNMFRVPDLRNKILFTLGIVLIYRLGAFIPAPGIDLSAVQTLKDSAERGGILGMLQLFSGGALTQFAIFALGIMPYITSSIILQILGVVVPKIEQLQQQGAVGQRKINQYTRYLTDRHRGPAVDRPGLPLPQRWRLPGRGQQRLSSTWCPTSRCPACC